MLMGKVWEAWGMAQRNQDVLILKSAEDATLQRE
jgi:hypothetical protein